MSNASVSTGLPGPQLKALGALLAGASTVEAARACSVSPRTLRDWLQQPEFRAALMQGQQQLLHQICMQLAGAAAQALRTLVEISEDPKQKGSVRVAAAHKVLHLFLHHGPRVSTLLAPPEVREVPEARATDSALFDRLMADLERVYGSSEEAPPAPVAAPLPPAAAPVSRQPEPPASGAVGTGPTRTHPGAAPSARLGVRGPNALADPHSHQSPVPPPTPAPALATGPRGSAPDPDFNPAPQTPMSLTLPTRGAAEARDADRVPYFSVPRHGG